MGEAQESDRADETRLPRDELSIFGDSHGLSGKSVGWREWLTVVSQEPRWFCFFWEEGAAPARRSARRMRSGHACATTSHAMETTVGSTRRISVAASRPNTKGSAARPTSEN